MARYELTCTDCGAPHEVGRKDARYCPSCRLLKNLEWAAAKYKRSRRCRACGQPFRPFRPLNRDTNTCGACMERADRRDPMLDCALCGRATAGTDDVGVCLACTKSPDAQPRLIKALRKGQRERRERFADRLQGVEAGGPLLRRLD